MQSEILSGAKAGSFLGSDTFALMNGAVSGGVGSVLGGGNFWQGAVTGLIVTAFNYLEHKSNEISDAKYEKMSDKQKSNYVLVPKEALVSETSQTVVGTITPSGKVSVTNTYSTEVWGETKWVIKKSLVKEVTSSKRLDFKSEGNRISQIFYRTYNYYNDWIISNAQTLIGALYPSSSFETVYKNQSQYTGGNLTKFFY